MDTNVAETTDSTPHNPQHRGFAESMTQEALERISRAALLVDESTGEDGTAWREHEAEEALLELREARVLLKHALGHLVELGQEAAS